MGRGSRAATVALAAGLVAGSTLDSGQCAGASAVSFRFVHVPKAAGMTLMCTFDNRYRKRLVPCRDMDTSRVPLELEGRHRTVAEFALATGADARTRTARGTCFPMITMLTDPVRRFLSAFNHRPPESRARPETHAFRLRTCYFLACRDGSILMQRNMKAELTPSEYALWPAARDIEAGHNMQTKLPAREATPLARLFESRNRVWGHGN